MVMVTVKVMAVVPVKDNGHGSSRSSWPVGEGHGNGCAIYIHLEERDILEEQQALTQLHTVRLHFNMVRLAA